MVLGKKNYNSTLMSISIRNYLIIIIVMFLLIAYAIFGFKSFYSNFYGMLEELVEIHSLHVGMDKLQLQIANYTSSSSKDALTKYGDILNDINKRIDKLKISGNNNDETYHRIKDIKTMISSYDEESKRIIDDYDSGKGMLYVNHSVSKLASLEGYIQDEITSLMFQNLLSFETYYTAFKSSFERKETAIYILVAIITVSCFIAAINFSRQISIPIHQLVIRSRRVAKGDLEIDKALEVIFPTIQQFLSLPMPLSLFLPSNPVEFYHTWRGICPGHWKHYPR